MHAEFMKFSFMGTGFLAEEGLGAATRHLVAGVV